MRFNPIQILAFLEEGAFVQWDSGHWLVSWNPCSEAIQEGSEWILGEFYGPAKPIYFQNSALIKTHEFLEDLQSSGLDLTDGSSRQWIGPKRHSFDRQLDLIFDKIKNEELKKAVPVIYAKSKGELFGPEKLKILKRLLESDSNQNAYGHWSKDQGVIGLTPEILFEIEQAELKTVALAGTRSNESTESLIDDPKEMNEHNLVLEKIKSVLSKFGKCKVSSTQEVRFKNITHLKTDVECLLDSEIDVYNLCNLMHPTPALGVHSQSLDHQWLKELDKHSEDKKFFGAPMGASFQGRTRILVGIRNIQWFDNISYLGSGCGIVAQSQPDKEWSELKLKRDVVKKNLGL